MKKISWMKRFVITLIITLFALGGCNPFNSNDIEGSIYEIGDNSIKIEVLGDDPEADYPTYEIFIDDDTVIEGTKDSFSELEVGDNVKIWVENQEADKKNAKKISVFVIDR
ncbi:hypothetical protein ACFVR1_19375 [Psychrobacillus sp. NPDC058041]|uniref:hypothetical protein n=1 Tax=Psychrobacillus sp. NPDC058041 TaxID=3346310 RepID=UPI0036DECCF8